MQATTLRTQLGLGSELVDWYREAMSVFWVSCWLICCHAQTIDYAIVQTPDPVAQNFSPGPAETIKSFGR